MLMWIVRFVMAFLSVFAVSGEEGQNALIDDDDYTIIANATFTIPSTRCVPITIAVPRGQYRLRMDLSNAPTDCPTNETLRFTDRVYKPMDCISYSKTGECGRHLSNADELCSQWGMIGVQFPGGNEFSYEGSECWDVDYFLAFSTDCAESFDVSITTELINLSEENSEACEGLVDAEKDLKEVYRLAMFLLVFVPVLLVSVFAFIACCFYCPGWPGHIILHMPRRPIVYRPSSSYRQLAPRPSQVS
ncbi:hypothetical protein BSKO_08196 [Bryopsis sp. KO-2023]|nr:hypothetical protein BSKO_08196 [Bryopsis sp. KO-2023]